MFRIKPFIPFLLGAFAWACTETQKPVAQTITIDLDQESRSIQDLNLIKETQIVPLETNDSMLIGRINKVLVTDQRIYIGMFEESPSILIFDRQGHALRKISRQGHGPGEYVQLCDFMLDAQGTHLQLLARYPARLLTFDAEGTTLISSQDLPKEFFSLTAIPGGYMGYTGGFEQEKPYDVWLLDDKLQVVEGLCPIDEGWKCVVNTSCYVFSQDKEQSYLLTPRSHNLYQCAIGGCDSLFHLDFGKYERPASIQNYNDLMNMNPIERSQFVDNIHFFQSTPQYWLFTFVFQGQEQCVAYDKTSHTTTLCDLEEDTTQYIVPFGWIKGITDKAIITEISARDMKPYVDGKDEYNDYEQEYPEQTARLRRIIPSIEESDNPCLVIYSF